VSTPSLQTLARRIAEQEAQLERLRQEHEAREKQLGGLMQRKQDLQAQLAEVEAEIRALTRGGKGQRVSVANGPHPGRGRGGRRGNRLPLRELVLELLRKNNRPMAAREVAEQALAAGYRTTSKDFTNVVWVALGRLNEVENLPGGGYRLKKVKA
jgi:hypothetical protein